MWLSRLVWSTKQEIKSVGYDYLPYSDAVSIYDPFTLKDGWNTLSDGEEFYYISNPALGLWADRRRFKEEKNEITD